MRSPRQELQYEDHAYLPSIRSVQLYPLGKESQLPLYTLGAMEQLQLTFDDLRADVRNYYFAVEHCNQDWTASRASVLDYVEGFNEDRVENFEAAKGTFQPYTRYSLRFPTANLKPKLAGNYLLKVYEDSDKERLVLTRRFYVLNELIQVKPQIQPSLDPAKKLSHQKLNIELTTALTIPNPQRDLLVRVLQNQRPDNFIQTLTPNFSSANQFKYNGKDFFDFKGNNEFRFVDLRSFRIASERMRHVQIDSTVTIDLYTDEDNQGKTYAATFDENGKFYFRNRDVNDEDSDGDYATVNFSFKTAETFKGKIYLVGGFNSYRRTPENLMQWDEQRKLWTLRLRLKQGLYDYAYILDEPGGTLTDAFSGSHFQTGNDYQILIYNRRIGTYWDELLGFSEMGINNRK